MTYDEAIQEIDRLRDALLRVKRALYMTPENPAGNPSGIRCSVARRIVDEALRGGGVR